MPPRATGMHSVANLAAVAGQTPSAMVHGLLTGAG